MFIRRLFSLSLGFIFLAAGISLPAQQVNTGDEFAFIDQQQNVIYRNNEMILNHFFRQLDSLVLQGDRKVQILQIGDSHIQADFFPNSVRRQMQELLFFNNGGRGFVFPYRIARTNSPSNYTNRYTGNWEYSKLLEKNPEASLGISGITVSTTDTFATIFINPNYYFDRPLYHFDRIRIFHKNDERSFRFTVDGIRDIKSVRHEGYTELFLPEEMDSLLLCFDRPENGEERMELYGIMLDNDDPGVVYSSIGVNGAEVEDYLKCELLGSHLQLIEPALVVISLGTNDAYFRKFDEKKFKEDYRDLIARIRAASPAASIIVTTPGDGYRQRKYYNYNYVRAREIIFDLARELNLGVWDFYTVMGGPNSIYEWYKNGLAQHDKLHLTREGYELQGKLFYQALLKTYYYYLGHRKD